MTQLSTAASRWLAALLAFGLWQVLPARHATSFNPVFAGLASSRLGWVYGGEAAGSITGPGRLPIPQPQEGLMAEEPNAPTPPPTRSTFSRSTTRNCSV